MNPNQPAENQTESAESLVQRLQLPFSNILLVRRAVTHRSYLNEHPEALEDNERLEFLGDAVLDFLVGEWLYHHFPESAEGELTRLRSALVRTEQLAEFARQINLGRALRLGHGEAESGGHERPALLCGAFEALIGAYYLNQGFAAVQDFMQPFLEQAVTAFLYDRRETDAKSLLQEWVQAQGFQTPFYQTIGASGPEHEKVFEVAVYIDGKIYTTGFGRSKQLAAKAAARNALDSLGIG